MSKPPNEDSYLMLSGIQHFSFCPRQWALIHIEQQWADNQRTVEGEILHENCHDAHFAEKRKDKITLRALRVVSHRLALSGVCDVVEFCRSAQGVSLQQYEGRWLPTPVEYKRGAPKWIDADRLQLCAQAMALEEMLACDIEKGYLYYAAIHRREEVLFDDALRAQTLEMAQKMNRIFARGVTPKAKVGKHCNACSLKELCVPQLCKEPNVRQYLNARMEEDI